MEQEKWGLELRINLFDCDREKITQKEPIQKYIEDILEVISMKPYGKCHVERFGEGSLNGVSAFQFLMTSSIVIHCREDNGHNDCFINIFSCKNFDIQKALIFTINYFNSKEVDFDYKER